MNQIEEIFRKGGKGKTRSPTTLMTSSTFEPNKGGVMETQWWLEALAQDAWWLASVTLSYSGENRCWWLMERIIAGGRWRGSMRRIEMSRRWLQSLKAATVVAVARSSAGDALREKRFGLMKREKRERLMQHWTTYWWHFSKFTVFYVSTTPNQPKHVLQAFFIQCWAP